MYTIDRTLLVIVFRLQRLKIRIQIKFTSKFCLCPTSRLRQRATRDAKHVSQSFFVDKIYEKTNFLCPPVGRCNYYTYARCYYGMSVIRQNGSRAEYDKSCTRNAYDRNFLYAQ